MFVLKFGGTSVATSENLKKVRNIVSEQSESQKVVVVVSALGGITNQLQECALLASEGKESYKEVLQSIEKRHIELCNELLSVKERNNTLTRTKLLLNDLEDIYRGVFLIRELSPRSLDHILSYGEVLSAAIISDYFRSTGLDTLLLDSKNFIKTDNRFGKATVDAKTTYTKIQKEFESAAQISVCPGFVASSKNDGLITTLGRGGSDYTAALIAAALEAKEIQIWTDVSGMMTSDPRLVPNAHPIEHLSYEEAMELSHFGAKVIYPPTIQPVLDADIPVHIKNTFQSDNPGTLISKDGPENGQVVKGTSCIQEIALCTLTGSGMIAVPNISYRLFGSLSRQEVNVIMITQASSEHSITVGIALDDIDKARQAISEEFSYEIETHKINPLEVETGLSIIALVGSRMKKQVGVSAKLFDTLSHNGVNIRAIAQGSTELNITVVIDKKDLKKSLNSIHESFFLSDRRKLHLFMIGVGNVGQVFIEQVKAQQEYLAKKHNLDVYIAGLANSRQMYFHEEGIDLENWQDLMENNHQKMDTEKFVEKMKDLNLRNSVCIDSTASEDIAKLYKDVLESSISIVTPNKIACSSSFNNFKELTDSAIKYKSKFLYETNVGAGLPVISTLNDLIKSGDEVHKIQAVLSGTLNFIFNNYDGTQKFSEVVQAAKEAGFTEPDPRIDLSGVDVMRKILILARVSGYKLELDDIVNNGFVPEECMNTDSLDEFYTKLDEHDEVFKEIYKKADKQNKRLKYVATFVDGKSQTGLEAFEADHPFYNLGGKDNIVLFHTNRYSDQPLVVKGAGAGAAVTASGIFADIMKIASA
ncbi:bifunctional aspartate kinase/homoserine dehydrogenase I [Gracilimonas sediminicola]|uniref:Bifunctional aspartate kinase/homoserine dehydrogenase I n=1 Tax=Gracilimonas sediminicola TaxID=2952158 RepID=A0A9X2L5M4_9BACT|nr:bifunctional aspartate kinase/homoserine dehydrogenase I [Gracilimonas sediminicola]MCP9292687.1 bifunctional aspartate kinase/homoserine dehydrogenase I [Gracilimonas sediminicola]